MQYPGFLNLRTENKHVSPDYQHLQPLPDPDGSAHANKPDSALKLTYFPEQRLFEVVWQRPVQSAEYRHLIRFTGLCIAVLRAEYILTDFSKLGAPSAELQESTAAFMQKALQNTTVKRSARVLAENDLQVKAHQAITEKGPVLPYKVQAFYSRSEARQWLTTGLASRSGSSIRIPLHSSLKALRGIATTHAQQSILVPASKQNREQDIKVTRCHTDFMEVVIDPEQSLLVLRWLRKVNSREFRYGILKAGRALIRCRLRLVLLNNQRMGMLTLGDQAWLSLRAAYLFSRSKLEFLAVVNSPDVMQQMASDTVNTRIRQLYNSHASNYFLSEPEAINWLLSPS